MTRPLSMRRRLVGDDDVTSCLQTRRVLQSFLDGEAEPQLTQRIARHLDACRACGLESQTYSAIKASLHTQAASPTVETLSRLTAFAASLPGRR